jgi:hypothetical protein
MKILSKKVNYGDKIYDNFIFEVVEKNKKKKK